MASHDANVMAYTARIASPDVKVIAHTDRIALRDANLIGYTDRIISSISNNVKVFLFLFLLFFTFFKQKL